MVSSLLPCCKGFREAPDWRLAWQSLRRLSCCSDCSRSPLMNGNALRSVTANKITPQLIKIVLKRNKNCITHLGSFFKLWNSKLWKCLKLFDTLLRASHHLVMWKHGAFGSRRVDCRGPDQSGQHLAVHDGLIEQRPEVRNVRLSRNLEYKWVHVKLSEKETSIKQQLSRKHVSNCAELEYKGK